MLFAMYSVLVEPLIRFKTLTLIKEGAGIRVTNAHCSKFDSRLPESGFMSSQVDRTCSHRNEVGVICFCK